jgi:hypothetical protein
MRPTSENPTAIDYHTWVENPNGPEVYVPTTSSFYKQGSGTLASNSGGNYPKGNTDTLKDFYPPPSVTIGDTYCAVIDSEYTTGYVGPGGPNDRAETKTPGHDQPPCDRVNNKPYAHFFGSDVSAGGGFDMAGGSCTSNGGIYAYVNKAGSSAERASGSGVQLGALSIDKNNAIRGFSSGLLRDPTQQPRSSTGLTFANSSGADIENSAPDPKLGGRLGGSHCITNYYGKKDDAKAQLFTNTDIKGLSLPDRGTDRAYYNRFYDLNGTGTLEMGNNTLGTGNAMVIYVNGNVHINNNIVYAHADEPNGWGQPEAITSLQLIVKGNIYVDPEVHRLDGLYVAQPKDDGSGGTIYSCFDGNGLPNYNLYNTACRSQLVVNGSFVAQSVYLMRSFSSLRYSQSGEYFGSSRSTDCGEGSFTSHGDCAAEIFNFSPEVYFAQPASPVTGGPTKGIYDHITSLAPVL